MAGGLSVGIGFGIKEVFSNFVSGLWLLFEGSVRPGSRCCSSMATPAWCAASGLRAAVLWRNRDNAELVIPNQDFFTDHDHHLHRQLIGCAAARWMCRPPTAMIPDTVIQLLEAVARSSPRVLLQPPPKALLVSYGDSGINYAVRFWIEDPLDNISIKSEVSSAIWHRFSEKGIEIPFPQRVISHAATKT
jgi:potassium efflux system protein